MAHTDRNAVPVVSDRLAALGFGNLGDDPGPEALEAVLRSWTASLNGADPLRVQLERTEVAAQLKAAGVSGAAGLADAALALRPGPESSSDDAQGAALALSDPEPWPEPVDGAELLSALVGTFEQFLALPAGAATALALWAVHAHAHDAAQVSPLLALTSPEKRCGKTTALELLSALVPRPLPAANLTPAATFRAVERFRPTLLVDEADSFLGRTDELRGILNSGHRRALAVVVRCVGDDFEARTFSTWAPKAIALIGKLPATLADRSIVVPMRRRTKDEAVERLRLDRLDELEPLRRMAWTWARDHMDELRHADPDIPEELHDRASDNWRPLVAIADLAGGVWPERARKAALVLSGAPDDDAEWAGVLLLADLRALFERRGADRLTSAEIVAELVTMEERPWPEWRHGRPLSSRSVARLLAPFGIQPRRLRVEGHGAGVRGYRRHDLRDAFTRYVPDTPSPEVPHPPQWLNHAENPESANRHGEGGVADTESAGNPHGIRDVAGVADRNGGPGPEGVHKSRSPTDVPHTHDPIPADRAATVDPARCPGCGGGKAPEAELCGTCAAVRGTLS